MLRARSMGLLGWRLEERSGSTSSPSLEVGGKRRHLSKDLLPQTSNLQLLFSPLSAAICLLTSDL